MDFYKGISPCKCGAAAYVVHSYRCGDAKWGHSVRCSKCHLSGPHCKTALGAKRKWNQIMQIELTADECATVVAIGLNPKDALRILKKERTSCAQEARRDTEEAGEQQATE